MNPFHRFNTSPRFQYLFHVVGTYCGFAVLVAMPIVYFVLPGVWRSASVLALVLITLYGNLSTDYCGVSDAEASGHSARLRRVPIVRQPNFLKRTYEKATVDAHFQYRLHLWLTYNWMAQAIAAILIFAFARSFWNKYAFLYTLLINGYTNFGTDFSALPGTLAATHLQELRAGKTPWENEDSETRWTGKANL